MSLCTPRSPPHPLEPICFAVHGVPSVSDPLPRARRTKTRNRVKGLQKGTVGEQRSHANLSVPPLTNAVAGARNYGVGHATALMNAWAHRRCVAVAQSLELSQHGAATGIVARRWPPEQRTTAQRVGSYNARGNCDWPSIHPLPARPVCQLSLPLLFSLPGLRNGRARDRSATREERSVGVRRSHSSCGNLSACGGVPDRGATCPTFREQVSVGWRAGEMLV